MDLTLPPEDLAWKARAKAFAESVLFPHELELETAGKLPRATKDALRAAVVEHGFNGVNHARAVGGQGCTQMQQTLINEELGKATGALWAVVWHPAVPLKHGTADQIRDYLTPSCLGRRRACVAITEPDAGSDPGLIRTTARRRDRSRWREMVRHQRREADYVMRSSTAILPCRRCSSSIATRRGFRSSADANSPTPTFSAIPFLFKGVEVCPDLVLGGAGEWRELTKDCVVEARLQIAANCLGASIRAFELANDWAAQRIQFAAPIRHHQAIEFMLADMAVEIMAAKSMLYRVAWEIDQGIDRKIAHARASVIKLHASEMAGRVLDKAVQIFGGRGYMRENPVERLNRDVRVDRIWEGTSEIQRMIIGGQLGKRGTELFTGWYQPPGA
jgi:alkylation response protein AidB-like acyl-CoA dehydrogenase